MTFVPTGGPLDPDTYTLTLRGTADGFTDRRGSPLDGDGDLAPGGDYVTVFAVTSGDARVVSLPEFPRGPGQKADVPATGKGIPVTISDGTGVESVALVLEYDPALLKVSRIRLGGAVPAEWRLVYDMSTPGTIPVSLYGTATTLPAGTVRMLEIVGSIPDNAPYAATGLLAISSLQVNKGTIAATADYGIQVVAYYGDVTGNGAYSGLDAAYIARVGVGYDSGFADAFRMKDPLIIGDVSGNGEISGLDAAYMARQAVGIDVAEIPGLPDIMPPLQTGGPDPLLRIPTDIIAQPGDTISVPILLDMTYEGISEDPLLAGDIVLVYDPTVFSYDSSAPGDLLTGWSVTASEPEPGVVVMTFYSPGPASDLPGDTTEGTAVEVSFTVLGTAALGVAALDMAALVVVGSDDYVTYLNEGDLTLTIENGAVNVQGANEAPEAVDDSVATDEDTALIIPFVDVLSNDTDADIADTVRVLEFDASATTGSVIDNGDESFTYDSRGHFDHLREGESTTETFTYRVVDDRGAESAASATVTITVNGLEDAPEITALSSFSDPVNESETVTLEGTFSDADSTGVFTVTVDWGDASASDVSIRPPGRADFSFTHIYGDDDPTATASDPYIITVKVEDDAGQTGAAYGQVTVANVAPTLSDLAATSTDEGGTSTLTGTITDVGILDAFTLRVDWDDGTPVDTFTYAAGTTAFKETHLYVDHGQHTIAVTLADDDFGEDPANTTTVTILNVTPVLAADSASVTVDEGQTATNTGTVVEPGLDIAGLKASVGTVAHSGDGTWNWTLFTKDGPDETQLVTITAIDSGGAVSETSFDLIVRNVAPTLTISGADKATAGEPYGLKLSSTHRGDDAIAGWVITWGDGSVEAITGNPKSVTHTYADPVPLTGDFDSDGDVDGTDAVRFGANVGKIGDGLLGDFDEDGDVDRADLKVFSSEFGKTGWNAYVISATASDEDGTYASNSLEVAYLPPMDLGLRQEIGEDCERHVNLVSSEPTGPPLSTDRLGSGDDRCGEISIERETTDSVSDSDRVYASRSPKVAYSAPVSQIPNQSLASPVESRLLPSTSEEIRQGSGSDRMVAGDGISEEAPIRRSSITERETGEGSLYGTVRLWMASRGQPDLTGGLSYYAGHPLGGHDMALGHRSMSGPLDIFSNRIKFGPFAPWTGLFSSDSGLAETGPSTESEILEKRLS